MYAIVDIAGQQFKVEKDQKIFVHRQEGEAGSNLFFDRVLLIDNGKNIIVGNPLISDALISAKILSHLKGDKVKIFKKRRRKGYQILKGHRQSFTEIQISEILEKGGSKAMKDAAIDKPEKVAVTKGKKVKEVKPQVAESKEQAPEVVAKTESVKKVTGKSTGKTKTSSEKKVSISKKETGKSAGPAKEKTPPAEKSSKTKSKTARSAPSKKTKKSSEK